MKKQKSSGCYNESNPHTIFPFAVPVLAFDDTITTLSEAGLYREREMTIEGKRFKIRSFFDDLKAVTPKEKLLHLIDSELAACER